MSTANRERAQSSFTLTLRRASHLAGIILFASSHRATAQAAVQVESTTVGGRDEVRGAPDPMRTLPSIRTAVIATIVLLPLDRSIQKVILSTRAQAKDGLDGAAESLAYAGAQGPFLAGGVFFAVGRAAGSERLADLGLHLVEGAALAAGISALGKGIAGRALPDVPSASPDDFRLGRGFHPKNGQFVSFPGGHAATAFASAAVLTSEAARWRPELEGIVGTAAYGTATLVAVARMYQNRHWASDNPLSIVIGTWSGLTVVRRQHSGPRSRLDRWLLGVSAVPVGPGAVAVGWSSNSGTTP